MHCTRLIFTALLVCAGAATAQTAPRGYDSAFTSYQKYQEPKVADWKETNAAIAATPGHAGHGAQGMDEHAGHVMPAAQAKPAVVDEHAGHVMPAAQAKPAPATPKPSPKPTPASTAPAVAKPDPHAEHKH